jgi:lipopolysaccharide/colanic/teichoic acid biosynthesis glycosyltransferase
MRAMKRLLDVLASLAGLVVLSPVLAAIAFGIYVSDPGAAIFRQTRAGRGGRPFKMWKFRTMRPLRADGAGPTEGSLLAEGLTEDKAQDESDERIFAFGRFLRRTSLDELPQLFNVLTGEMSLVGPRPTLVVQVEAYDDFQRRRLDATPGITGWAQVKGRNLIGWPDRIKLDVWYVDNWSLWLDARILALTVWQALRGEGVYQGDGGS